MTWASERLAYLPPQSGEAITLTARLPASAAGGVVHLVPKTGLEAPGGWIREIVPSRHAGQPRGLATWTATSGCTAPGLSVESCGFGAGALNIRCWSARGRICRVQRIHGDDVESQVELRPYQPLGIQLAAWWPLPAWLTWFVALTLVAYLGGQRWLSGTVCRLSTRADFGPR